ncbi:unnamed protein product [Bursaphelenchus xylophilus]|uniref:(pine wood nematode) hypothetical protein n=1 Tax=Bursaphelenchus xylophilus TaxID=6326 RepID=A0A7I8WG60_BURXY|nr:unnamed protein product [Bursaphelenchus xylophilus]CAG9111578.1 unnamed protein product [Bursaphelenchus xylophilus]
MLRLAAIAHQIPGHGLQSQSDDGRFRDETIRRYFADRLIGERVFPQGRVCGKNDDWRLEKVRQKVVENPQRLVFFNAVLKEPVATLVPTLVHEMAPLASLCIPADLELMRSMERHGDGGAVKSCDALDGKRSCFPYFQEVILGGPKSLDMFSHRAGA